MKLHSSTMTAGATSLAAILGLAACVTINIYFPAAAAEKAADRIIDEVWQLQQKDAPNKAEPATDKEPKK
jgi:hypothetical protein